MLGGNEIMEASQEVSPRVKARIAGLFELLEALTSGFGMVVVPGMLIVVSDAAATLANVSAHEQLFRLSILAGLLGIGFHIAWSYLFYQLFKPVSESVSLLAVLFAAVAIALQGFSNILQAAPLVILQDGRALTALSPEQMNALAFVLLRLSGQAFNTYLAFFGVWCVLIGYLIAKSRFMPRIIGLLEALSGLCWIIFVWPPLAHYVSPYNQVVAGIGEISLMLWLLIMGVNAQKWKEQAAANA